MFDAATHSAGFLNLGREKDVADFLLRKKGEPGPDGGYESASSAESAVGDGDAVDLADDYVGRNNKKGQRRAVRLDEVGPRMELRLIKISEGVPGKEGAVMYHEFSTSFLHNLTKNIMLFSVRKSKKEIDSQKAEHAAKVKLKKQRKEEQERNVLRKKGELKDEHEGSESDDEGDGLGEWDDEEDVSDEGEEEDVSSEDDDSSENEQPAKKVKLGRKG